MPISLNSRAQDAETPGFRVTGRLVLATIVTFFAVIIGVNVVMAFFAVRTFGGVETASSYQAGLTFRAEEETAQRQDSRGWTVDARLGSLAGDGLRTLDVDLVDAEKAPVAGLAADVRLLHPTDSRLDRTVTISETAPGRFSGIVDAPRGQWNLRLDFSRDGERLFRSTSRIALR
jgi:nitrogen fixation protein FixH